jgi:hypothetical protein
MIDQEAAQALRNMAITVRHIQGGRSVAGAACERGAAAIEENARLRAALQSMADARSREDVSAAIEQARAALTPTQEATDGK